MKSEINLKCFEAECTDPILKFCSTANITFLNTGLSGRMRTWFVSCVCVLEAGTGFVIARRVTHPRRSACFEKSLLTVLRRVL